MYVRKKYIVRMHRGCNFQILWISPVNYIKVSNRKTIAYNDFLIANPSVVSK